MFHLLIPQSGIGNKAKRYRFSLFYNYGVYLAYRAGVLRGGGRAMYTMQIGESHERQRTTESIARQYG